jgi:uncharacterized protein YbjT (DUF2867 family)
MKILVCGASGFVGGAIAARLAAAGHEVVRAVRRPAPGDLALDYAAGVDVAAWTQRLAGFDAVVNAVGILVQTRGQSFEAIHARGPQALFEACAAAGVPRVLQISALGANRGDTAYFKSKLAADEALMRSALDWAVLRPALIYGEAGDSARMFRLLASLPVVFLPAGGRQLMQPVHIDDLTEAVLRLLEPGTAARRCVDAAGPRAIEYRQMLRTYRHAMGFPEALGLGVPALLIRALAATVGRLPGAILNRDTWRMLQEGNTGDSAAFEELLGRPPRAPADFIAPSQAALVRAQALAAWRRPFLQAILAAVWVASGLVSVFLYPYPQSLALLERVGLEGGWAYAALVGAASVDIALGLATLLWPGRRLWALQAGAVAAYTAITALALPELLIDPFGPILKNLPILALLFLLYAEEREP